MKDETVGDEYCGACGSSWEGELIPDAREPGARFGLQILLEDPWLYDGACAQYCPFCGTYEPLGTSKFQVELFRQFMENFDKW